MEDRKIIRQLGFKHLQSFELGIVRAGEGQARQVGWDYVRHMILLYLFLTSSQHLLFQRRCHEVVSRQYWIPSSYKHQYEIELGWSICKYRYHPSVIYMLFLQLMYLHRSLQLFGLLDHLRMMGKQDNLCLFG